MSQLKIIVGQKVSNDDVNKKFAAAPRDVFVYNTHPETIIEDVKEVLTDAKIDIFGNPAKKSHEDCWMASFHVRVCHDHYEKLQNPTIWPLGWKCRDFIRKPPA